MHLIYLDESGNTGNNLTDQHQPVFVLCALLVPESKWLEVEASLSATLNRFFPGRPDTFEVHANEILNPRGFFRAFPVSLRLEFIKAWLDEANRHGLRIIHRAIIKKRYARWLQATFGSGVSINPHNAAFLLITQVVNDFLRNSEGAPLGILISDENHEVMPDLDKIIRLLRGESSALKLNRIIEKGFFIGSAHSLVLQLCDLCAYALRRMEEESAGFPVKPLDANVIPWVKPLIHRGVEPMTDVLAWLESQQKKERPGN